jgi:hypothetical protein
LQRTIAAQGRVIGASSSRDRNDELHRRWWPDLRMFRRHPRDSQFAITAAPAATRTMAVSRFRNFVAMAYLWTQTLGGEWRAIALDAQRYALCPGTSAGTEELARVLRPEAGETGKLELALRAAAGREQWVLLTSPGVQVSVNGFSPLGLAVLNHGDEIRLSGAGQRLVFSAECPARVEPFPHSAAATCPRCHRPIAMGMLSVRCPKCRLYHHHPQGEPSCWTYGPRCAKCDCQTTLGDGAPKWMPEGMT